MEVFNFDKELVVIIGYVIDTIRMNPLTLAGLLAGLKGLKVLAQKTKSTKDDKICTMLINLFKRVDDYINPFKKS